MADDPSEFDRARAEMNRLLTTGLVGFHTHLEATEIFAVRDGTRSARNVFSIYVAEEHQTPTAQAPAYLGPRIRLKSLTGWMFGIRRYVRPLNELDQAIANLGGGGRWQIAGETFAIGPLIPLPTQFVPPDSTEAVPWNGVLKNNFWAGSYVLEWADPKKSDLGFLLSDPPSLQTLSEAVQAQVPIKIASLSDRVGNLVVQIPATILVGTFGKNQMTGEVMTDLEWHPKATPRPVRVSAELQFDQMISGYVSAEIPSTKARLWMSDGPGMMRAVVWDDANRLILAATSSTAFITTIVTDMRVADPEPRVFTIIGENGVENKIRVALFHSMKSSVRAPAPDRGEEWTRRRIYRDEAARLAASRRFVQYMPAPGRKDAEHEKALADIRALLNQYGEDGAWLWDPFLSATDILKTLFYCGHQNAELRALTAGHERPSGVRVQANFTSVARLFRAWIRDRIRPPQPRPDFVERQRATFRTAQSNFHSLRLEFRMKTGSAGWDFHDRFIIFPRKDGGALAWSLGTSVNSVGKQHHILQQVDNGQLVKDAFDNLWSQLDRPEHLVWCTP